MCLMSKDTSSSCCVALCFYYVSFDFQIIVHFVVGLLLALRGLVVMRWAHALECNEQMRFAARTRLPFQTCKPAGSRILSPQSNMSS